jgi:hypothetical protein
MARGIEDRCLCGLVRLPRSKRKLFLLGNRMRRILSGISYVSVRIVFTGYAPPLAEMPSIVTGFPVWSSR